MMRKGKISRSAWTTLAVGGVLVGWFVASLGEAQDSAGTATGFAGPPSFADVIEQVRPAVVNIEVMKNPVQLSSAQGVPFAGAPFEDFLERFGFSAPGLGGQGGLVPQPMRGAGSGFVIDEDGYIATNYHVVEGASDVVVTLDSGEKLEATVVGTDPRTDLALLRVRNGAELPAVRLGDSDQSRIGDWVLAIGNPFGLGGSATAGIISARGRDIQSGPYDDYLQVDAAINSGNSGGPVFNAAGEVIGINTAIFSPNGGNIGIGFAIPSNQARNVLDELRDNGQVSRGWLGVSIGPVVEQNGPAAANELVAAATSNGALIDSVVVDGPADRAGLARGDIVTRFDGHNIDSPKTLSRLVGEMDQGDRVEIEFLRTGDRNEVTTVLGELDEAELRAAATPQPDPNSYYYRYESPRSPFRR
jgi:serine protease Do